MSDEDAKIKIEEMSIDSEIFWQAVKLITENLGNRFCETYDDLKFCVDNYAFLHPECGVKAYVITDGESVVGTPVIVTADKDSPEYYLPITEILPRPSIFTIDKYVRNFVEQCPEALRLELAPDICNSEEFDDIAYRIPVKRADLTKCNNMEDYLNTLGKRSRKNFRQILTKNADITVEVGFSKKDFDSVLFDYLSYWFERKSLYSIGRNIVALKYLEFVRGKLDTLEFTLKKDGVTIATNHALVYDKVVYDMICVRNSKADVADIGKLAILKNIELAISMGYASYDLLTSIGEQTDPMLINWMQYKDYFVNTDGEETMACFASVKNMILPPVYVHGMGWIK